MIIYKCVNKITGKVYIGQTVKDLASRINQHIKLSKRNAKSKFHKALLSYGEFNFDWNIIDTASSKAELNQLEIKYIIEYNSIENGYNMVEGGTGGYNEFAVSTNRLKKGKHWDEIYSTKGLEKMIKSKEKSSNFLINYNKNLSKEEKIRRAKLGNKARTNKGYKHSDVTKEKISISNKNKVVTLEQRKKISEATKEAMKCVDRELLGKKSVEARRPFWNNKHKQQKEKIIELKNKNISVKKIIAELNISTPTYYKLWNEIKANTI
jgi:group I intron endonuclease